MMKTITSLLLLALGTLTAYADPVRHNKENFTPDYLLIVTAQNVTINCQTRYSVLVNGTFPGPKLTIPEGQSTWVRVWNRTPDQNFTMHWHGLAQSTAPFSDGTPLVSQWPIKPNEYFDYQLTPEVGTGGGTFFYHGHVGFHAITAHGALIVKEQGNPPYKYDQDVTLMVGDFYQKTDAVIEAGLQATPFVWSGEPNAVVINGRSGTAPFSSDSSTNSTDNSCKPYVINVEPDTTVRLRFVGRTALSLVLLGIANHTSLDVIEADGAYTNRANTDHMQVATGQRFSALLKTKSLAELIALNQTDFWIRYETRERPLSVTGYALLRYKLPLVKAKPLPVTLPSVSPVTLPQITYNWLEYTLTALKPKRPFPTLSQVTRSIYITVAQQPGATNGSLQWGMNGLPWNERAVEGTSYAPYLVNLYKGGQTPNYTAAVQGQGFDPATKAFPAKVGEVIDLVWLSNNGPSGGWDYHPFHFHGSHFFDMGSGNGTYDPVENEKHFSNGYTPATRDTTNLYRYATKGVPHTTAGWRAWRFSVTEKDIGAWLAHCHILQHMIMGMQTTWVFGDRDAILKKFPSQPYINGYLNYGGDAYGNDTYDPLVEGPPTGVGDSSGNGESGDGKGPGGPPNVKRTTTTTTTTPPAALKTTSNKRSTPAKATPKGNKGSNGGKGGTGGKPVKSGSR